VGVRNEGEGEWGRWGRRGRDVLRRDLRTSSLAKECFIFFEGRNQRPASKGLSGKPGGGGAPNWRLLQCFPRGFSGGGEVRGESQRWFQDAIRPRDHLGYEGRIKGTEER